MGVTFTEDQQRVIDTRNRNILVSAAAGSGKTAVLVERIIQKICAKENPVDIDRLLIVTFTSAAAAQMRERISDAIMKRLEEDPENEHLQKQSALIHNAQITTIDSFCLFIIRNNFNAIGLDPGFRVADEGEIKLTKKDVIDQLLEDKFAEADDRFLHFVECYSTGVGEQNIEEAITRLYDFSMSYPFPEEWLESRKKDYDLESLNDLPEKDWYKRLLTYLDTMIKECISNMQMALKLAMEPSGPDQYIENLEDDIVILQNLGKAREYDKLYKLFDMVSFSTLSRKKGTDVDPDLKDMVKGIRDGMKDTIKDIQKNFFQILPENIVDDMKVCKEVVEELVDLTLAFKERLDAAKRDKNLIDFSDMEHFALQILLKKDEEGNLIQSETALEMQDYFEEIMIDEYQDSNDVQELLLKSISGEAKGNYNRFMVGDVKQSIYKFRLARPEIFMEKYNTYDASVDAQERMRIDLSKNFRSRQEVTDATNFVCGQIMRESVGNVDYDEKAVLNLGATYYPAPEHENDFQTEVIIAEPNEEEEMSNKELEAHLVAQKILELKEHFKVTDSKTGELRPTRFGDIVLLFRATSGWDEDFRKVLATYNIPVHISSKTGYFQTLEIQGIVNLLKVLDNPLQDIPFYGFLKLPFIDFTEMEIASVKTIYQVLHETKEGEKIILPSLYEQFVFFKEEAFGKYSDILQNTSFSTTFLQELKLKAEKMLSWVADFRQRISYTPIKELIQEILLDTGYASYVGSLPGGEQRKANMELLLEKAGTFEKTSFYGLFHFIRYLETIQEQDVDFGEANILDENADVVRIMTIHKSKGLEFPICFVCGMSKQFNLMDTRQSIVMDVEAGIGVDFIDPEVRIKRKTLRKNIVSQLMKEDTRGEDLRVFYVAMTRAREKLFLTGYCKDFADYLKKYARIMSHKEQKLSYSDIMDAKNYFDLVILSCMRHRGMKPFLQEAGVPTDENHHLPYSDIPVRISTWKYQENLEKEVLETGKAAVLEDALLHTGELRDEKLASILQDKLLATYTHENLAGLTVKTTVSELKKAAYEEILEPAAELFPEQKEVYVPTFMREEALKGTQYGTAVHKVMELLSYGEEFDRLLKNRQDEATFFADCKKQIKREMDSWIAEQIVDAEDISCVRTDKIAKFFESSLAKRMIKAKGNQALYQEQPFVIGLPASRLKPEFPDTETILIQGVIDVFFYEDDEIVLVDYKTDHVLKSEELVQRYKEQLKWYEDALTQLTGKRVKERIIYSFRLDEEIPV